MSTGFNNPESQARAVKASRATVRKRRRSVTHKKVDKQPKPEPKSVVCTGTVRGIVKEDNRVFSLLFCPPDCPVHNVFSRTSLVQVRSDDTQPKRNQPNRRAEG